MREWLDAALVEASGHLSEEAAHYAMGRGLKESLIREMGMGLWEGPSEPAPDPVFRKRFGARGEKLSGMITTPIYNPRGRLLGVEFRAFEGPKRVSQFLLPEAKWNPVFIGMPMAMDRIWNGGDIWIVEGLFDLAALHWVAPERDAILATLRARLSFAHVQFLARFASGMVNMVYDQDETGQKAVDGWVDPTGKERWGALRSLERVQVPCRKISFRGGKDPGEIWDKLGADGVRATFQHAIRSS